MDISMYTCYSLSVGFAAPADAFSHFYKKGVRYADIVDNELEKIPLHLYCRYLQDAGLSPYALVSTVDIASASKKIADTSISVVKGYIDQMEKLGMSLLMLAPSLPYVQNEDELTAVREREISAFSEIIEYTKNSRIKIAIENQSSPFRPDSKTKDIRYILDCIPTLGFVLDSGNFFCVGEDVLSAFDKFRDRMIHSHFKDWKSSPAGHYQIGNGRFDGTALGKGILPLTELIDKFRISGYDGKVVLEVNSPDISLETLELSAEFLRTQLNKGVNLK